MASNEIASSNPMKKSGDLYTCGVCLLTFDKGVRMPKFLPCSHTFCLSCVTKICEGASIRCPYCRKRAETEAGVNNLPNNPYVLDWLNSRPQKNPLWCLECGKLATKFCRLMPGSAGHPTVLKDAAPKDCRELQKIRSANDDQLESIIQKLKDREFSLEKLSAVLKDLQDENHSSLEHLSQLKAGLKVEPGESVKSLRLKSEETSVDIQEEMEDFQQKEADVFDLTKSIESLQLDMKTVATDKFLMK